MTLPRRWAARASVALFLLLVGAGCGFKVRVIEPDARAVAIRPGTLRLANRALCDVPAIEVPYDVGLTFDSGRLEDVRMASRRRWQKALESTRRFGEVPATGPGESRESALRGIDMLVELRARISAAPDEPTGREVASAVLLVTFAGLLNFVDLFYTEQDPPLVLDCTAALIGPDGRALKQLKTTVKIEVRGQTWYRRSSDWLMDALKAALERAEGNLAAQVADVDAG
jgi:hypothetical protein